MNDRRAPFEIDARLRRLAAPQLGVFTVSQAATIGVDRSALQRRCDAGALDRMFAEVLRFTTAPATMHQRFLAAALAVPGSAVAATSAAVLHGLPVAPPEMPTVSVSAERSARTDGIHTVRQRVALPSSRWHTVRLATPAATLLLLPRFVGAFTLERCVDHCLAHRLTSVRHVRALIDEQVPRAVVGRAKLLGLLAERESSGIGHRSALEQRVGRWLRAEGLTGSRRNHRVAGPDGAIVEVDFAWLGARVALEVSPFFTHGSRVTQERDVERRRLLTGAGWTVVEATDPDLVNRAAFRRCASTIRSLLCVACAA